MSVKLTPLKTILIYILCSNPILRFITIIEAKGLQHNCSREGNPCKDGLIVPMWKPDITHLKHQMYSLVQENHRITFKSRLKPIIPQNNLLNNISSLSIIDPKSLYYPYNANVERIKGLKRQILFATIVRGFIYFLALIYLFIGVSIVADKFMAAIEVITSKEKDVAVRRSLSPTDLFATSQDRKILKNAQDVTIVTVRIWNETVSNLTLMALGSSAPEILLSIIEVMGKNFEAGDLGPGTIVGSAAFNLFIIVGICILIIPSPELRKIRYLRVFFITATWSIFAYIWLYLILAVISPGKVTLFEALITFAFFPLTVLTAYVVDVQMYKHWWAVPKRYGAQYKKSMIYNTIGENELLMGKKSIIPNVRIDETGIPTPSRRISVMIDGTTKVLPLYDVHPDDAVRSDNLSDVRFAPKSGRLSSIRKSLFGRFSRSEGPILTDDMDTKSYNEFQEFEKTRQLYMQALSKARQEHPTADMKTLESIASYNVLNKGPKSRAFYRIQATRKLLTKQGNLMDKNRFFRLANKLHENGSILPSTTSPTKFPLLSELKVLSDTTDKDNVTRVYFDPGHYTCMENVGKCELRVVRVGDINHVILVDYETRDGTAKSVEDYVPVKGTLTFERGKIEAFIYVGIIDDELFEEDEYFYVDLKNLRFAEDSPDMATKTQAFKKSFNNLLRSSSQTMVRTPRRPKLIIDNPRFATVMIFDDDHAGTFSFDQDTIQVAENTGILDVKVIRKTGARGKVYVPYETIDGTAIGEESLLNPRQSLVSSQKIDMVEKPIIAENSDKGKTETTKSILKNKDSSNLSLAGSESTEPKDYEKATGYLVFENEQLEAYICVRINDTEQYEKNVNFQIKLGKPLWTKEDQLTDVTMIPSPKPFNETDADLEKGYPQLGSPDVCTIVIRESKLFKNTIDKLLKKTNMALLVGTSTWKDQFREAFVIGGEETTEKGEQIRVKPSCTDYFFHILTLFWKVLFATIPPTEYWGGWLCFVSAIIWIGILTALIGDLAAAFGCTIGLKDAVTAISFVALGTSVPDTFASKVAATQDDYADASIGNVTGSNAVNVFLGIGLAWTIAAIYHVKKGTVFYVDPGSLAFSVTIYCVLAVIAIIVLMIKRYFTKGELGGPRGWKNTTAAIFIAFWLIYLLLASLESYCYIKGF